MLLFNYSFSLRPGFLTEKPNSMASRKIDLASDLDGSCTLNECWESYYAGLDRLGIRDDIHRPSFHRDQTTFNAEQKKRCSVLRGFSSCVQNASRACRGDLNFHSTKMKIDKEIIEHKCILYDGSIPSSSTTAEEDCIFPKSNISAYRHCVMYGDPHLRNFNGQFQTCRVQGAWPFVDNDFLTVQITSGPIGVGEGTFISKVTVIIKQHDVCALGHYVTYQAHAGELPATFDNGRDEFNSVEVVVEVPGRHVEIDIGYKQTTIIIRLTGIAYSVSVSMPVELFEEMASKQTVQLCEAGCPFGERVDLKSYFGSKSAKLKRTIVMSKDESNELCRLQGLRDFYFDSCVYDLMTTGDPSFSLASNFSYTDLIRFLPEFLLKNSRGCSTIEAKPNLSPVGLGLMLLVITIMVNQLFQT